MILVIPVPAVLTHKMQKFQNAKLHMDCKLYYLYLITITNLFVSYVSIL